MSMTTVFARVGGRNALAASRLQGLFRRLLGPVRRRPARLHPEDWSAHMLRDVGLADANLDPMEYPSATSLNLLLR
ncbi:MAG TPA: hypothetical protein VMQ73_23135 [Methylomirabilota bacterium]|nr:hypothetical protein [Methylomirabilota bacterium]